MVPLWLLTVPDNCNSARPLDKRTVQKDVALDRCRCLTHGLSLLPRNFQHPNELVQHSTSTQPSNISDLLVRQVPPDGR